MTKSTPTLTQSGLLAVCCNASATEYSSWPGVVHTASACMPLFGIASLGHDFAKSWSTGPPHT